MKDNPIFYVLLLFLGESRSSSADIIQAGNGSDDDTNRELYIVYMGAANSKKKILFRMTIAYILK